MNKMPCHISDEKGSHIVDPADAPEAREIKYNVLLLINGYVDIEVIADNEAEAIEMVKRQYNRGDIVVTDYEEPEVMQI